MQNELTYRELSSLTMIT